MSDETTERPTTVDGRPYTPRSTELEVARRVSRVIEWVESFHSRSDILRKCTAEWGVAERQGETYLARAYAILREDVERDRAEHMAEHAAARRRLIRLCIADTERQLEREDGQAMASAAVAGRLLDSLARLLGLGEKGGAGAGVDPVEQLRALLLAAGDDDG